MKNPSERAKSFIATREHHLSEIAEDYVEIISDLLLQKGKARVCDLAKFLGISHVTVIRTIERLKKQELVNTTKDHPITLTAKGSELALFCKQRHLFLLKYLISLGVPTHIAEIDAEGMEHHVSPETLQALKRNFLNS
jgi:DtxR family transcriptional regulator, manganese transport regulator